MSSYNPDTDNVKYIKNGGDKYTQVRCEICDFKYVKEEHPEGSPCGCVVKEPEVEEKEAVEAEAMEVEPEVESIHIGSLKGDE
jgi:hypothetical protein